MGLGASPGCAKGAASAAGFPPPPRRATTSGVFAAGIADSGLLRNLLILYQTEIEALMHQRDRVLSDYRVSHGGREPYEDRDLEVTGNLEIQVETQVSALEQELQRRGELKG